MAEYKQYITQIQENGNVMISEDVVTTIVAQTLNEVEGVAGLANLVNKKNLNKSLKVQICEDNSLNIECDVLVGFGYAVVDVAQAVQQAVTGALESMTGTKVNCVNVNVCGIVR